MTKMLYNVYDQETKKHIKLYLGGSMLRMRPSRGRQQWRSDATKVI